MNKENAKTVLTEALAAYGKADLTGISIQTDEDHDVAGDVAYSWYRHMLRTCEAVAQLADAGFDAEIAPLRRSLMEHCTALFWITRSPKNAVDSLFNAYQQTLRKIDAATEGKWDINYDLLRRVTDLEIEPNKENNLLSFAHLTESTDAQSTYAAWLQETAFSHAGWSTGRLYLTHEGERLISADADVRDSYRIAAMYIVMATDRLLDYWNSPGPNLLQAHSALSKKVFRAS